MPIYMDRHDVPMDIYPEHVAQMHQEDLKIQHLYGCKGITYWCDEERKAAFCLIDAPDEESLRRMHQDAHGDVPHQIIEVDNQLVELFLGRIEDPENIEEGGLNVIRESAYRILLYITFPGLRYLPDQLENIRQLVDSIETQVNQGAGRIVEKSTDGIIISYTMACNAVEDAIDLFTKHHITSENADVTSAPLRFVINAGAPVTEGRGLFGEALLLARRMSLIAENEVMATSEVMELYEKENPGQFPTKGKVKTVGRSQVRFISDFMDLLNEKLQNPDLRMEELAREMGLSKSQLYRNLRTITGLATSRFIKYYRVSRAVTLLERNTHTIAEVAFDVGFNSPSYFTKSFQDVFGMLPSVYLRESVRAGDVR